MRSLRIHCDLAATGRSPFVYVRRLVVFLLIVALFSFITSLAVFIGSLAFFGDSFGVPFLGRVFRAKCDSFRLQGASPPTPCPLRILRALFSLVRWPLGCALHDRTCRSPSLRADWPWPPHIRASECQPYNEEPRDRAWSFPTRHGAGFPQNRRPSAENDSVCWEACPLA